MQNKKPLLSILIPTKDRYLTLFPLIKHLLSWEDNDFEVLVQDNTLNNSEAVNYFRKFASDLRFKYCHTFDPISGLANAEFAINNSYGEYIVYLGDDDGIIRQALSFTRWMKSNGIDSLNCKHGRYLWPNYRYKNHNQKLSLAGAMYYRKYSGRIDFIDPKQSLLKILELGALSIANAPRLYHGIVRRDVLDVVRTTTGTYFPGPTPDMANAVALTFFVKKHVFVDFPIIIAGLSGNSMGGRGGQKKSHGKIEDEHTLPAQTASRWSKELPRYWAPQTIWPESALQALKLTGNDQYIPFMNFAKIFAELYIDTSGYRNELLQFINENTEKGKLLDLYQRMIKYGAKHLIAKLKYRVMISVSFFNLHKIIGFNKIIASDSNIVLNEVESMAKIFAIQNKGTLFQEIIKDNSANL